MKQRVNLPNYLPSAILLSISRSCFPILFPCDESPGVCQHLVLVASRFIRENKLRTYFFASWHQENVDIRNVSPI